MAFSEVYVDPSIAGDSGTGTIGDPFGDLEYAIEQTTFDTTNGTRVNIKAGTDEVLAAELSVAMADAVTTPAWVPSRSAVCVFQGYTAVAGDGGIGGISGGGSVSIINDAVLDNVSFVDLHLHNSGANKLVVLDNECALYSCDLEGPATRCIEAGNYLYVTDCYFHDLGTPDYAIVGGTGGTIQSNYINGSFSAAAVNANGLTCRNNIVILTGNGIGFRCTNSPDVSGNSIFSTVANTGAGIDQVSADENLGITNNLIEGFSGVGGEGIAAATPMLVYGGNAVYDCTTPYTTVSNVVDLGDNETLTASPFTDAANGDFSPVDTGNVKEGALPNVIGGGFVG